MPRNTSGSKALQPEPESEEIAVEMPAAPVVLPSFTSERLQLLAPLITPRVWQLALFRFCGGKLVKGKEVTVSDPRHVVKLALVLAFEMWPHIRFAVEEEALMRGMNADKVNPYKKEGLIRAF